MNHTRPAEGRGLCSTLNACHPERSLTASEASRQTEPKDPVFPEGATGTTGNFRVVVRFFDDHDAECLARSEPRSGKRMQPTAQAVGGNTREIGKAPQGRQRSVRVTNEIDTH